MRLYFDNAATSFPKPPGVSEAVKRYMDENGASAGRGAYREAMESGRLLQDVRSALRRLFDCRPDDDVIFTLNGTDALNMALSGLLQPGDHAVTTMMDHNSVLRPLSGLERRRGITWSAVPPDPQSTRLTADDVAAALTPKTRLVALNHASNVTGVLQPLDEIARLCRDGGVLLLVDAAQSAGHVPISFADTPIDMLATPGHKGLLGPQGTGVLVLRAGLAEQLYSYREGGTGSVSEEAVQPEFTPDKFESGSHNAAGLAGLLVALRWLEQQTITKLREHELGLMQRFIALLDQCPSLRWYGPRKPEHRVGVFSVRTPEFEPQELSAILEQQFNVLTRSGLHCAPLAHRTVGTETSGGTTRLSLGPLLTNESVEAAGAALREITARQPA